MDLQYNNRNKGALDESPDSVVGGERKGVEKMDPHRGSVHILRL